MRDPKRIDIVLAKLKRIWKKYPDLRLGQILCNAAIAENADMFYIEDRDIMKALDRYQT